MASSLPCMPAISCHCLLACSSSPSSNSLSSRKLLTSLHKLDLFLHRRCYHLWQRLPAPCKGVRNWGSSCGILSGRGNRFVVRLAEKEGDGSSDAAVSAIQDRSVLEDVAKEEKEEKTQHDARSTSSISSWLYPSKEELPDDVEMSLFDHLEELRQRIFVSVIAVGVAILGCFVIAKDIIVFLEAPVFSQGVRFLQLSPGEYFFTTLKVSGYCGLLLGSPVILYEIIAFILPGLTRSERRFLGPIVFGSSVLFYTGLAFSYSILTPAALNFFVSYAQGAVESIWSIDQYFEFVLVLMFSTGLAFQVPVIQLLLGQTGLVSGDQMLSAWRYVVVGAVIAAAVLTPSTDPLTQMLLAGPLIGLYLGGAFLVNLITVKEQESS